MYGTVARLRVKTGKRDELLAMITGMSEMLDPGEVAGHFFALDQDPDGLVLVAVFASKDAYAANAQRPETHERYLKLRSYLAADPEWLDGSVVSQFATAAIR
jgi:hypothetical protein